MDKIPLFYIAVVERWDPKSNLSCWMRLIINFRKINTFILCVKDGLLYESLSFEHLD
jgi:hypothetical protein